MLLNFADFSTFIACFFTASAVFFLRFPSAFSSSLRHFFHDFSLFLSIFGDFPQFLPIFVNFYARPSLPRSNFLFSNFENYYRLIFFNGFLLVHHYFLQLFTFFLLVFFINILLVFCHFLQYFAVLCHFFRFFRSFYLFLSVFLPSFYSLIFRDCHRDF